MHQDARADPGACSAGAADTVHPKMAFPGDHCGVAQRPLKTPSQRSKMYNSVLPGMKYLGGHSHKVSPLCFTSRRHAAITPTTTFWITPCAEPRLARKANMASSTKLISDPSQNNGPALMGIAVSFTSLAAITVATRLWVRSTMVGKVGWDVSRRHEPDAHVTKPFLLTSLNIGLDHLSDDCDLHCRNG